MTFLFDFPKYNLVLDVTIKIFIHVSLKKLNFLFAFKQFQGLHTSRVVHSMIAWLW